MRLVVIEGVEAPGYPATSGRIITTGVYRSTSFGFSEPASESG